jgi:hypothetical protein
MQPVADFIILKTSSPKIYKMISKPSIFLGGKNPHYLPLDRNDVSSNTKAEQRDNLSLPNN